MEEFKSICIPYEGRIAVNQVGFKADYTRLFKYSIGGEVSIEDSTNGYCPDITNACKPFDSIENNHRRSRYEFSGECLHYRNLENDEGF